MDNFYIMQPDTFIWVTHYCSLLFLQFSIESINFFKDCISRNLSSNKFVIQIRVEGRRGRPRLSEERFVWEGVENVSERWEGVETVGGEGSEMVSVKGEGKIDDRHRCQPHPELQG